VDKKIFDNSNIAESYAGVTTPLTFSFVQYVYQEVYQHFSKMMGVSDKTIKKNEETFKHMVELIGCQIYYNLSSWHKMLTLFPGYQFSAELMEMMMGVEKRNRIAKVKKSSFFLKYFYYFPKTILHAVYIFFSFVTLGFRVRRFNSYFEQTFSDLKAINLEELDLSELRDVFWKADTKLLSHWKVPIANDFAVMISTGLTDKLFMKWFPSDSAYSHIRMLAGNQKNLISLDPGDKLTEIAEKIKQDTSLESLFLGQYSEKHVLKLLREEFKESPARKAFEDYLQYFGARMPNELKLESETLMEKPEDLVALIRSFLAAESSGHVSADNEYTEVAFNEITFVRKVVLKILLRWSSLSVSRREEARFSRTLIFGYVRNIFLSIGKLFEEKGVIDNKRDIFYLTIEEVFDLIDGQKLHDKPFIVINQRKKEFNSWQELKLPRRIETTKSIAQVEAEISDQKSINQDRSKVLTGRVASRPSKLNQLSGTALTLDKFDPAADFTGKILVTCQTDPGWTVIFPLLKGVIVERGGMLSHAAIVARELNIPCLVGVENATKMILNGASIEMDLQKGLVEQKR